MSVGLYRIRSTINKAHLISLLGLFPSLFISLLSVYFWLRIETSKTTDNDIATSDLPELSQVISELPGDAHGEAQSRLAAIWKHLSQLDEFPRRILAHVNVKPDWVRGGCEKDRKRQ